MNRSEIRFATSDIEANDWTKFLVMGFFDGENYKRFFSPQSFVQYLTSTKKYNGWRIYFHNGGKYDFLFLIDVLYDEGFELRFINRGSSIISMEARKVNFKLVFADSYALFPMSLDRLQKEYNSAYQKIPVDFTKNHSAHEKNLNAHLENDCKGLYDILTQEYEHMGVLKLTRASQALAIFERDYLHDEIYSVSKPMDDYFRQNYYHGGRVEVYKVYAENLNYYDVNSLFPFVMLEPMPCGEPKRVRVNRSGKIGFYEIEIKTDLPISISPLIYANKTGNYYFRAKKGDRTYGTSNDIEILKTLGISFSVLTGLEFEKAEGLFSEYVTRFFEEKKNATGAKRVIAKLMLNALYGKLGQRLLQDSIETYHGQEYKSIVNAEYDLVMVAGRQKKKYNGIYLASWITSLARGYHFKLMLNTGLSSMVYCDTDSLITTAKMTTGNNIGELKLEDEIVKGVFLSPKTYAYVRKDKSQVIKVKGFDSKDFDYKDLLSLAKGKRDKLETDREGVASFRIASGYLKNGKEVKRVKGIVREESYWLKKIIQHKELTFDYTRRKLLKDTRHIYKTLPLTIKEIEA
jgi:hypothetical protein